MELKKNFKNKQKEIVAEFNNTCKLLRISNTMGNFRLTINKPHIDLGNTINKLNDNNLRLEFTNELIDMLTHDLKYIRCNLARKKELNNK